jgi:hypothetical protein
MTKVYVLYGWDLSYDDSMNVLGVYSSYELAEKAIVQSKYASYEVQETVLDPVKPSWNIYGD